MTTAVRTFQTPLLECSNAAAADDVWTSINIGPGAGFTVVSLEADVGLYGRHTLSGENTYDPDPLLAISGTFESDDFTSIPTVLGLEARIAAGATLLASATVAVPPAILSLPLSVQPIVHGTPRTPLVHVSHVNALLEGDSVSANLIDSANLLDAAGDVWVEVRGTITGSILSNAIVQQIGQVQGTVTLTLQSA